MMTDVDDFANVTPGVLSKVGRDLHRLPGHPLCIIKREIEGHFERNVRDAAGAPIFKSFDNFSPRVTVKQNFDELNVAADHVSRSRSDTFYFTRDSLLRTHTSAHQTELMRQGHKAFLVSGDCYRRDEIDATHYPVFHQMEGVRVFSPEEMRGEDPIAYSQRDLKSTLEGVVTHLFGQVKMEWDTTAFFPFTDPSMELNIHFNGKWLEVLGSGVIHPVVLANSGLGKKGYGGWAFGLGLERLAMVLFDIPDIRYFWSTDPRFLDQFKDGKIRKFQAFSKHPPCHKDISFWIDNPEAFVENDFSALVRETAGDLVESVRLLDEFKHPKTGRTSRAYRIVYRHLSRELTNKEVDELQVRVRDAVQAVSGLQLR